MHKRKVEKRPKIESFAFARGFAGCTMFFEDPMFLLLVAFVFNYLNVSSNLTKRGGRINKENYEG